MAQSIIGLLNLVHTLGLIGLMYYIAIRKKRQFRIRYIFYYVIFWSIVYMALLMTIATAEAGLPLEGDVVTFFAANLIGYVGAFIIIDIIIFFAARFIYQRNLYLQALLNPSRKHEEEQKTEQKHKTKNKGGKK